MMNLIIDEGNTRIKYAIFNGAEIVEILPDSDFSFKQVQLLLDRHQIKRCIASSTRNNKSHFESISGLFETYLFMDHSVNLPVTNRYETPETLGKDRLAGAIGGFTFNKNADVLVIDAGTALTFDYVDAEGAYLGGTISPGLTMRLRSLNHFTSKLPLVDATFSDSAIGKTTTEAIQQGVFNGIKHEIEGVCEQFYNKYPHGKVFLTGGDAVFFEKKVKSTIFVNSNLVLIGLNSILEHNAD